jgi:hypothetical protein
MDVEIAYSRWQKLPDAGVVLPMQLDVSRVGRPYKRMTTISAKINPVIAADSFAITDSLRSAFFATARRPMFDLPMDSARIVDGSFALFGAPGTPTGAVKVGGHWLMIEAGTAPLTIERSVAFLHRTDAEVPVDVVLVTAPTGAGGIAWLARQQVTTWVTDAAAPFARGALRGWPAAERLRDVGNDRWLRIGTDSVRIETIDLPDYPRTAVVYVPSLRWAYAWPAGPVQMGYIAAHARRRGWQLDRIASARTFPGAAITAASAAK